MPAACSKTSRWDPEVAGLPALLAFMAGQGTLCMHMLEYACPWYAFMCKLEHNAGQQLGGTRPLTLTAITLVKAHQVSAAALKIPVGT